jgi:signal transduction histidine kinase
MPPRLKAPRFSPYRSIFASITLLSVLIALLATALLFGAARWVVIDQSNAAQSRMVDTDLAGLVDIYASGGTAELQRRLADRLALADQGADLGGDAVHYLLARTDGKPVAGDIRRWPSLSAENSQSGFVRLDSGAAVFARATLLDPTHKLLVAREYRGRDALIGRIGVAFAATGMVVVLLTVSLGLGAALRLRRRVRAVNAALRHREHGTSKEDVDPDGGRHDELDLLSEHVQRILARQSALIESHRNISDQTAHELRTPLMHLDMQLLQSIERTLDPGLLEMLVRARGQIKTIIRMLESLLDIAANEAQRGERQSMASTDLSQLATSLFDLFVDSATDLGLTLRAHIAPGIIMECDAMQMSRLLSNLLDNALKYVPAGGTIELTLLPGPVIKVVDDGPGIAPAMRETIFGRFQRSGHEVREDEVRGHEVRGHGLGLALVRAIAERHGLQIRCEDSGPGAAFIVSQGEV